MSVVINGTTGITSPDFSGAGPSLTGVQAASGPSSSAFALRNKVINGGFTVSQRGNQTLTSTPTFFADRWVGYILSGTSISGTLGSGLYGSGFDSVYAGYIAGTWTTGTPVFRTRIESLNSMSLDGKSVTLSLQLRHDLGASQDFYVRVYKANSTDNFGATTPIGAGTATIPNATITKYSLTFSISTGDALNGLEIQIFTPAAISATSKFIYLGSVQLEAGSIATPFEQRPIGLELSLCQRYYQLGNVRLLCYALAGAGFEYLQPLPVVMRATPVTSYTGALYLNASGLNTQTGTAYDFVPSATATANGSARFIAAFTATAEL